MTEVHILTIAANLPISLLDRVLTATERALDDLGVSRVRITSEGRNLRVVADVPLKRDELDGDSWPNCSQ
ncbi:hypothetical protein GCM10023350_08820 [Nocardioides endophyticus]|uniref:Uncharacterized protein n=1 Tax=Nocardioides endophyticus TaxID=1353775 RepID=A0ABP8YGR9_9ACTN